MNVVLVVVDTLRRDAISPYGSSNDTPNLQQIADRSLVFENMAAASCWTMPTHASMFTGLYPSKHRAMEPRVQLSADVPIVSELLQESGFRTHAINIPHPLAGEAGFNRGWDEYQNTHREPKHVQAGRLLKSWVDIGLLEHPTEAFNPAYVDALRSNYRTRYAVDKVAEVTAADGNSFAFTNLFAAHRDYKPLPPDAPDVSEEAKMLSSREDYYMLRYNYGDLDLPDSVVAETKELYEAEVRWVDENIGRLFDTLERRNVLDETVVMITGDHGELFGESDEVPQVAHRNSLHPLLLDVPFIMYHPELDPERDDRLASHVDIAPTILDAAGVGADHEDVTSAMDGHSLLGDDRHDVVFAEHGGQDFSKPELEAKYGLDLTAYTLARKVARTGEYTVRFRSDDTVVGHDRRDPDAEVPEKEIDRLRTLVDEELDWTVEEEVEVTDAVRERLEQVGYLG